jgi:hypothetical protein
MTSLRQRMVQDMQIRNLAVHTQNSYVLQVSMFARHFGKSPEMLGPDEIRTYQIYGCCRALERTAGELADSKADRRLLGALWRWHGAVQRWKVTAR